MYVPRKCAALREQTRQRQETNISVQLNTACINTMKHFPKSRRNEKGGKDHEFEVEQTFVRKLRLAVAPWRIDLWLDHDCLRGYIPDASSKNAAEKALRTKIKEKVGQIGFVGSSDVEIREIVLPQLETAGKYGASSLDLASRCGISQAS